MGGQIKAANRASPLAKFTITALYALPRDQQAQVLAGQILKHNRSQVRKVLKQLQDGSIPDSFHPRDPYFAGEIGRRLREIYDRYDTAHRAAIQRDYDNWEPPPVDDAAWEQELRRRANGLAYQVAERQLRRELPGASNPRALVEQRQRQLLAAHDARLTAAVQALVDCQCEHCKRGSGWSAYCREDVRIRDELAAETELVTP
jgi:hypothetical protein